MVTSVEKKSPAAKAGLRVNDEVLKVNGEPTGLYIIDSFRGLEEGAPVDLLVRRGGKMRHMTYKLKMKKRNKFVLEPVKNPTELQKTLLGSWFKGLPK